MVVPNGDMVAPHFNCHADLTTADRSANNIKQNKKAKSSLEYDNTFLQI
jgi:hypothetical protein